MDIIEFSMAIRSTFSENLTINRTFETITYLTRDKTISASISPSEDIALSISRTHEITPEL